MLAYSFSVRDDRLMERSSTSGNGHGSLEDKPILVDVDVSRLDIQGIEDNLNHVNSTLKALEETRVALEALKDELEQRKEGLERSSGNQ